MCTHWAILKCDTIDVSNDTTVPPQYQSGNVTNVTMAPTQEDHADALGCYQSGNPSNEGMVPYCVGHRGNTAMNPSQQTTNNKPKEP